MRRAALPLLCAAFGASGLAAEIPVVLSGSAAWIENISRTSDPATAKDGDRYEAVLSADFNRQLGRDWFGHAGLDLRRSIVPDFDRRNALETGLRLGLRRKFGLGPFAPAVSATAGLKYRDSGLAGDDGWLATAELGAAKRLTETLRFAATGDWLQQYAGHSTFDIRQRSARLEFAWDFSDRWSLGGSAGRIWGDLVANAAGPVYARALAGDFGPVIQNYYSRISFETNHAYGPNWVSYRVQARADTGGLALTCTLTPRSGLEMRADRTAVRNRVGVRYETDSYSLSLAHRF